MTTSSTEIIDLVTQLRAEVNDLRTEVKDLALALGGRKGWSNSVQPSIPSSTWAAIDRLSMPKSAQVDLMNGVPDRVIREIGREDRGGKS
jgi:hypothetical protein